MIYVPDNENAREGYAQGVGYTDDVYEGFDLWYAEEIRKAKEEAWDEGCESGEANEGCGVTGTEDAAENPYREEKND